MKKEGWKILAIILAVLLVLETIGSIIFFTWLYTLGTQMINNENICSLNICKLEESNTLYDAYYYDSEDNTCSCYKNGEVTHTEVITGNIIKNIE